MVEIDTPSFFPATRAHGLERLDAFAPRMGRHYTTQRNTDFGPERRGNVSVLSPFHRYRLIAEEETIAAALSAHSPSAAEKFVQEVYWRTYFKGWLERRPWVWQRYRHGVDAALRSLKSGQAKAYEAAIEGRTGIDGFDQWAHELTDTGYLHNHARMWFASIWIFTLRLPWVLGADHFYRHLLDGDAASNTLSWRWVAGLHTQGKNYIALRSNILKHTDGRYDPGTALDETAAPLEDDWNGPPGEAPSLLPMTDEEPALLLLHEDDFGLETQPVPKRSVAAVATLTLPDARSPQGASALVSRFAAGAAADTRARAEAHYGVPVRSFDSPAGVIDAVRDAGVGRLVAPYAPVGPVADALAAIRSPLGEAGIRLDLALRAHDRKAWPHCAKGFFPLKKKIPGLLPASA